MNLSEKLKKLREKRGLTQREVALRLGVTDRAYAYYEQDRFPKDHHTIKTLAAILNVTLDDLLSPTYDYSSNERFLARSNENIAKEDRDSLFELFNKNIDLFKKERIDYSKIVSLAYEIIIKQNCNTLPLDPLTFKIDNVILMSFQEYSEKTGISVDTLTRNGKLKDGYTMSKDGLSVIFYDAATYEPRQRFTRFHEIGHVVLNHNQQCEKNESEANFFAAQCILPNALLKEIKARGYTITKDLLVQTFNVSDQVALYRLDYLKDYPDLHKNEYDDIIVELFKSYLDSHFPSKRTRDNYDFLEEQEKRNDW